MAISGKSHESTECELATAFGRLSFSPPRFLSLLFACLAIAACQTQVRSPSEPAFASVSCLDWNTSKFLVDATVEDVRRCLGAGADAGARTEFGNTPLHLVRTGEVAQHLIDAGADVNAIGHLGHTPLHSASNAGIARVLLEAGAIVDARDTWGRTALHWTHDAEIVQLLLEAGAKVDDADHKGGTPLHRSSGLDAARALLQAGADVNARDHSGRTPLHEADSFEEVELLASAGAELEARTHSGETPLHMAAGSSSYIRIVPFGSKRDLSPSASREPWPSVLESLIAMGADVKARDNWGNTPLHEACRSGFVLVNPGPTNLEQERQADADAAANLLRAGAEANVVNRRGETPLHMAAFRSNDHSLRLLLAAGADVGAVDEYGRTALHFATEMPFARTEVVSVLLDAGADAHAVDSRGKTPLDLALETRDYLLKRDNPSQELVDGVEGAIATLRAAIQPGK